MNGLKQAGNTAFASCEMHHGLGSKHHHLLELRPEKNTVFKLHKHPMFQAPRSDWYPTEKQQKHWEKQHKRAPMQIRHTEHGLETKILKQDLWYQVDKRASYSVDQKIRNLHHHIREVYDQGKNIQPNRSNRATPQQPSSDQNRWDWREPLLAMARSADRRRS